MSCTYGRDNFESWGKRRKRREVELPANVLDTGNSELDTQMRLSHEIVVLDFGDEQTSPFDFDSPPNHPTNNSKSHLNLKYLCHVHFESVQRRLTFALNPARLE